jgi:hypothetical protein
MSKMYKLNLMYLALYGRGIDEGVGNSSQSNDFEAAEWLRRNRERIESGKVRKQIHPKKEKPHRFKVTYSKGKPSKFG